MNNNAEKDTKKVLDRLSITTSEASSHTFDTIDKTARKLSDIKSNYFDESSNEGSDEDSQSNLSTSDNPESSSQDNSEGQYESRLKTNENVVAEEGKEETTEEFISRLKTNAKNPNGKKEINSESNVKNAKQGKLKTAVSKTTNKVFKFNENQGKISKTATVISKTGSKVSKVGSKVTRTSRELNKMISSDGTGKEYFSDKIGRKAKKVAAKPVKKVAKKVGNKVYQTIGKKMIQTITSLILKMLKILISLFVSLAEIIIPVALVLLIIIALGSIFGSGSSDDKTISKYSEYMTSIQEEYNQQVDDWLEDNPDGIVVGVKGNYGQIDWRIPLAIMQSTNAELSFDQDEKNLLEKFKDADLLEKHEEIEQTIEETDDEGNITETTKPILIITNGMYDDYLDWCRSNYSYIAEFNKKKKVTDGSDTWFSADQLDILEMLYQSDDYAELLGSSFKTHTPTYGSTTTKADLNSEYYNSKNALTISGFKGQCTWYSYGRGLELFNKKLPTGDARTWLSSAVSMGLETGTQPSYNSVVVLVNDKFGHVAFVEAYDGKSITISEGNVGNPCSRDDSCSAVEYANEHANEMVRTKIYSSFSEYRNNSKSSGYTIVGFIYLD